MLLRRSLVVIAFENFLLNVHAIPTPQAQDVDDVAPLLTNLDAPGLVPALTASAANSAEETPNNLSEVASELLTDDDSESTASSNSESLSNSASPSASSTDDEENDSNNGFNMNYIIPVIVVGSILLLATVFGWIYGRGRRVRSKRDPLDPYDSYYDTTYQPKGGVRGGGVANIWNRFTSNTSAAPASLPKYGIPDENSYTDNREKHSYDDDDDFDDSDCKYSRDIDPQQMLAEGRTGTTAEEHEYGQHQQNSLGQMKTYVMESIGSARKKCREWYDKTLPRVPDDDFLQSSLSGSPVREEHPHDPPASPQTMALKPTKALRVKVKERPLGSGKSNVSTKASSAANGDLISPKVSRSPSAVIDKNKNPDLLSGSPRSHAKGNLVRFSQVRRAQKAKRGTPGGSTSDDSSTLISSALTSSDATSTTATSYDPYTAPAEPKAVFSTPPREKSNQHKYEPIPSSTPTRSDLPDVLQPRGSPAPAPLSPPKNPGLFYSPNLNSSTHSTDSVGQGNGTFSLTGMANMLFPSADRPSQMPTSPTGLKSSSTNNKQETDVFGSPNSYTEYRPRKNTHDRDRGGTVSKSRKLSRRKGGSADETVSKRNNRVSFYDGEDSDLRRSRDRRIDDKVEMKKPSQPADVVSSGNSTDRVEQIIRRGQIKRALEQPKTTEESETGNSGISGYSSGSSRVEVLQNQYHHQQQHAVRKNGNGNIDDKDGTPRRALTIGAEGLHNQGTYSFSTRPNPFS